MLNEIDKIGRREKLKAEGWPKTLSELFDRTGISFDRCARMSIDLQQEFITSPRMEGIAAHARDHIAPAFNQIGVPTYWVYWPYHSNLCAQNRVELIAQDYQQGAAEIYDIWPAAIDKVLPKHASSAFRHGFSQHIDGPTLTELTLYEDEVELLLVDGFVYDECVTRTIVDAGVIFLNSDEAIATLKKRALQKPTIQI